MNLIRRSLPGALALGAMLLATQGAKANTLLPILNHHTQIGPNLYRYFYDVDLQGTGTGSNVVTGAFVTIYDYTGFSGLAVDTGITGTNGTGAWNATIQNVGFNAALNSGVVTPPSDDPTKANVTFHYTGIKQNADITPIFSFFIDSTFGTVGADTAEYGSQDFKGSGAKQANYGTMDGATVPEMSTVLIFGGFIGTGLGALRRNRKRA